MSAPESKRAYKVMVALGFGLMGFYANFHPLNVSIPPNEASFVWGLVFPMLISLAWGWKYGLLSATLGLGAQTMWWLWLPKNGWAVLVAVPVYNLWIVWHGWCAKNVKRGMLANIYGADIPYRIFFAIMFATVFAWSFRFNPSPWAPQMTLTTAPEAFMRFIQFKVIVEGYMILILADVMRNLRVVRKILLLEQSGGNRADVIISGALLFGLVFWIASGMADHLYSSDRTPLAESLILNISPVHLMERLVVIVMCLVAGLVIQHYFARYRKSEDALKELNRELTKYLFALESVEDEAYLIAPDGAFEYVNKAACRKLGYTRGELLTMSTPDVDPLYDQAEWEKHFPRLKAEGSLKFESLHKRRDGSTFPVEILANYFEYGGMEYNMAFVRDITERKEAETRLRQSEAHLRKAQSIARLGSWHWDIVENTLQWSDEIYRLFGLRPEEFGGTYEAFLAAVHPEDRQMVMDAVNRALRAEEPYDIDHRIVRPDGTERMVHENAEVVRGEDGSPISMSGTVQDITERVLASRRIEHSLREKEVLLKEVHHRVKNNMAIISALLRMQAAYVRDETDLEMFKESQSRIKAMALVHEKLYKTESFAEINVRDYLQSLVTGITATFAMKRGVRSTVEAEDAKIEIDILIPCGLIINELVTNACKHAFTDDSGSPEIAVRLESEGDRYVLTVADNGRGLPEGLDPQKSDGLGFKLVHTLCMQLGGTLSHRRDGGTTFRLTFPKDIPLAR